MTGAHFGMGQPGNDREVVPEILQRFEIRRERVVFTGLQRNEIRGVQAQGGADADHASRRRGAFAGTRTRRKKVERGEGEGHAGCAEKSPPRIPRVGEGEVLHGDCFHDRATTECN